VEFHQSLRRGEARLGVERSTIYPWYRANEFPVPHYLGERRASLLHEIMAWEKERLLQQRGGQPAVRLRAPR